MARWFDLTQPVQPGMPKLPFMPEPRFESLSELTPERPKVSALYLCAHLGTHVDAPNHFIPGGKAIGDFPLERFLVEGLVVRVDVGPTEPITAAHLEGVRVGPGEALILSTGWGEVYNSPDYYEHPYLSDEAARWVVARGVGILGLDFLTPDKPVRLREPGFNFPAHRILLGNEVLIIENLTGLRALEGRRVRLFCAPLPLKAGVEAAWARVFAEVLD